MPTLTKPFLTFSTDRQTDTQTDHRENAAYKLCLHLYTAGRHVYTECLFSTYTAFKWLYPLSGIHTVSVGDNYKELHFT